MAGAYDVVIAAAVEVMITTPMGSSKTPRDGLAAVFACRVECLVIVGQHRDMAPTGGLAHRSLAGRAVRKGHFRQGSRNRCRVVPDPTQTVGV